MTEFLAWKLTENQYFGKSDPTTEQLRRPWPKNAPFDLIETSYFGFSIPEERINCEIYFWIHPAFNVVSGGVMCFQGMKFSQRDIEYIEYRNYMPIPEDITNCTYANGVSVRMREPLKSFQVDFKDPQNDTYISFESTGIMPAAFRPAGGHYTQAMRNRGTLVLRGREYKIGGHFSRDRSWGDPRTEATSDVPPIGWHVAVFSDDLAFHVMAFDSKEENPALAERYPNLAKGPNHLWGYVWRDGRLLGIKSCRKRSWRDSQDMFAERFALQITDEEGKSHDLIGHVTARYPFAVWPNVTVGYALTEWTYQGRVGYGDSQEALYNRFVSERLRRPPHVKS